MLTGPSRAQARRLSSPVVGGMLLVSTVGCVCRSSLEGDVRVGVEDNTHVDESAGRVASNGKLVERIAGMVREMARHS